MSAATTTTSSVAAPSRTSVESTTSTTPGPTSTDAGATTSTTAVPATGDVVGFPLGEIGIDGRRVPVAVADTRELRGQGLRGVADLGDLAGMLFVWEEPVLTSFGMRDVPITLDLALLDADGVVIETLEMVPCETVTCPSYAIDTPWQYAIESPAGSLDLGPGDEVDLP